MKNLQQFLLGVNIRHRKNFPYTESLSIKGTNGNLEGYRQNLLPIHQNSGKILPKGQGNSTYVSTELRFSRKNNIHSNRWIEVFYPVLFSGLWTSSSIISIVFGRQTLFLFIGQFAFIPKSIRACDGIPTWRKHRSLYSRFYFTNTFQIALKSMA